MAFDQPGDLGMANEQRHSFTTQNPKNNKKITTAADYDENTGSNKKLGETTLTHRPN